MRKHKEEEEVQLAIEMTKQEQISAFATLKKKGIMKENQRRLTCDIDAALLRERDQGTSNLMVCGGCKGIFSQKRIWRHKRICTGSNITKNVSLAAATLCAAYTSDVPDDFRNEVLVRFRNDEVGNSCRTDNMLVLFGQKLWAKSIRRDKKVIMTDMRTLANLLVQVRKDTKNPTFSGEELFVYTNFNLIEYAIEQISEKEDGSMKAGLKLNLGYLIKKAAKMMKGQYIIGQKLHMAKNIDRFLSVLDLNWDFIFYRAQMIVEGKRDAVLRKPQAMPIESDITKLHDFTKLEMENLIKDEFKKWDAHDFIKLRSLIVCRLTMFNARRGGEPARLTMKEWQDAEANVWVDPQLVITVTDPYEASLVDQYKLAYQSGKGSRKLVPVLIPNDTIAPLRKLCEQRVEVDINLLNPYLFPLTQSSKCHVQGWDCVNSVVKMIGNVLERPSLLTADKFRHRASTLYAMLDIPQQEREAFYRHMGHSAEVNKNIYQCPLAIKEITQVGRFLESIDGTSTIQGGGLREVNLIPISQTFGSIEAQTPSTVASTTTSNIAVYLPQSTTKAVTSSRVSASGSVPPSTSTATHSGGSGLQPLAAKAVTSSRISASGSVPPSISTATHAGGSGLRPLAATVLSHSIPDYEEHDIADLENLQAVTSSRISASGSVPPSISTATHAGGSGLQPLAAKVRKYTIWNKADTAKVMKHFSDVINDTSQTGAKGSLPGKRQIEKFLENVRLFPDMTDKERIQLIKTKIFNDRNRFRGKATSRLQEM